MDKDLKSFYAYGSEWERTFFDEKTGGFLVTELSRKYKDMSPNDRDTFIKEQRMGMKYASFGFQIQHLDEKTGISTPDAFVNRHGRMPSIIVNGHYADFKSSQSGNNAVDYAKHAIREQGAEFVLWEFTSHHKKIPSAIREMISNGIHGYYYYSDEETYRSF